MENNPPFGISEIDNIAKLSSPLFLDQFSSIGISIHDTSGNFQKSSNSKNGMQGLKLAKIGRNWPIQINFSIFNFFIKRAQIVSIRIAQSEESMHESPLVNNQFSIF